jgi:hypothetical protein
MDKAIKETEIDPNFRVCRCYFCNTITSTNDYFLDIGDEEMAKLIGFCDSCYRSDAAYFGSMLVPVMHFDFVPIYWFRGHPVYGCFKTNILGSAYWWMSCFCLILLLLIHGEEIFTRLRKFVCLEGILTYFST